MRSRISPVVASLLLIASFADMGFSQTRKSPKRYGPAGPEQSSIKTATEEAARLAEREAQGQAVRAATAMETAEDLARLLDGSTREREAAIRALPGKMSRFDQGRKGGLDSSAVAEILSARIGTGKLPWSASVLSALEACGNDAAPTLASMLKQAAKAKRDKDIARLCQSLQRIGSDNPEVVKVLRSADKRWKALAELTLASIERSSTAKRSGGAKSMGPGLRPSGMGPKGYSGPYGPGTSPASPYGPGTNP